LQQVGLGKYKREDQSNQGKKRKTPGSMKDIPADRNSNRQSSRDAVEKSGRGNPLCNGGQVEEPKVEIAEAAMAPHPAAGRSRKTRKGHEEITQGEDMETNLYYGGGFKKPLWSGPGKRIRSPSKRIRMG